MLELDAVTKRFGGLTAVRAVSLRAAPGEIVGIIGPNGAGKTTLFNVISGFYAPDEGRVLLDGRDVSRVPAHQICGLGLCRTFQIVKPFGNLSVEDNVMIGALTRLTSVSAAREEARRVTALCRLESYATSAARSLPIGLRKRLEVARALATKPRLLLLDEVMAGLNATELGEMITLIRSLHAEGLGIDHHRAHHGGHDAARPAHRGASPWREDRRGHAGVHRERPPRGRRLSRRGVRAC